MEGNGARDPRYRQISNGNTVDELLPLLYDELKAMAAAMVRGGPRGGVLDPTALVHEGYLKLAHHRLARFQSKAHFLAVAAKAIRSVLVDLCRQNGSHKRGLGVALPSHSWTESRTIDTDGYGNILDVHEALTRLAQLDERKGRLVELRFFEGLSNAEAAAVLGISLATVKREWSSARIWLHKELNSICAIRESKPGESRRNGSATAPPG